LNSSEQLRQFWSNQIGFSFPTGLTKDETVMRFHLKVEDLGTTRVTTVSNTVVSITSMHFLFPYCKAQGGDVVVPISPESWFADAKALSDFALYLPIVVDLMENDNLDFFHVPFSLLSLLKNSDGNSTLLERGILEFIFPNATFETTGTSKLTEKCSRLYPRQTQSSGDVEHFSKIAPLSYFNTIQFPLVRFNPPDTALILHLRWDPYTFITCGLPRHENVNFGALFTPYETLTWGLILGTALLWPLLLSFIENNFDLKAVLKDLDALFIGWAIMLEQSHLRACNYTGRQSLYVYCTATMIAFLVLCNAYRGDNIQTLTKSFEVLPITNMEELLASNYTMYTKTTYEEFLGQSWPGNELIVESLYLKYQISDQKLDKWNSSFRAHRFGENILDGSIDLTWYDIISACNNTAMSGWKSELITYEKRLIKSHNSDHIFIGDEHLYKRYTGIEIINYGLAKYHRNFYALVESGVYTLLVNFSNKPPPPLKSVPKAIEITGNIAIQFCVLAIGVGTALIGLISEKVLCYIVRTCKATTNFNSLKAMQHFMFHIFFIFVHQFEVYTFKRNRPNGFAAKKVKLSQLRPTDL